MTASLMCYVLRLNKKFLPFDVKDEDGCEIRELCILNVDSNIMITLRFTYCSVVEVSFIDFK